MYKFLLFFILIILSVFLFTACGGDTAGVVPDPQDPPQEAGDPDVSGSNEPDAPKDSDDTSSPDDSSVEDGPQIPAVFFFKMGDVIIDMNQNIDYVISNVGEPLGIFEAPSCAFDGIDRIFSYPGLQLYTYPHGDDDLIHTIGFFDDSVRTAEGGIRLGAKLQAVTDAYGDDYVVDTGMYKFTRGSTSLEFLIDDDMVIGITYGYKIEQ